MAIKLKVTLWYTLLMAALCVFTLVIINRYVVRSARATLEDALNQAVALAANNVEYEDGTFEIDDDDDIALIYPQIALYLYDDAGELLFGRREVLSSAYQAGGIRDAKLMDGGSAPVLDRRVNIEGIKLFVRGVALTQNADGGAKSLRLISMIVLPLFVILGGAGGYMLTRRAFMPVKRITDAASRITGSRDFSLRIAAKGPNDELHALANAIDRMLEALENAYEAERRLTADASHELRTPLAGILSQCENALSANDETQKTQALEQILESGRAMTGLLSKLLMLARMDARMQALDLEALDLSQLAEICAQETRARLENGARVIERITPGVKIMGDQSLIMQLMLNLMSNAARHVRAGGDIVITLARAGDGAVLSVRNDGERIPEAALDHIFDRFYRADASRAGGGAGLGLAIVKSIADMHGARVAANNDAGGVVFSVTLPKTA